MELVTKYRLVKISEKLDVDHGSEKLKLYNSGKFSYMRFHPEDHTFDSIEECLEHAKNSKNWNYCDFTILPVYRIY